MFTFSKYKIINTFFNKKESNNINDNDIYILEDSKESKESKTYQSNDMNNDTIIDIPMLEDLDNLESYTYENNSFNIQQNHKSLFNIQKDNRYIMNSNSIYRFVKQRR